MTAHYTQQAITVDQSNAMLHNFFPHPSPGQLLAVSLCMGKQTRIIPFSTAIDSHPFSYLHTLVCRSKARLTKTSLRCAPNPIWRGILGPPPWPTCFSLEDSLEEHFRLNSHPAVFGAIVSCCDCHWQLVLLFTSREQMLGQSGGMWFACCSSLARSYGNKR